MSGATRGGFSLVRKMYVCILLLASKWQIASVQGMPWLETKANQFVCAYINQKGGFCIKINNLSLLCKLQKRIDVN
jgi:hypothetical protein